MMSLPPLSLLPIEYKSVVLHYEKIISRELNIQSDGRLLRNKSCHGGLVSKIFGLTSSKQTRIERFVNQLFTYFPLWVACDALKVGGLKDPSPVSPPVSISTLQSANVKPKTSWHRFLTKLKGLMKNRQEREIIAIAQGKKGILSPPREEIDPLKTRFHGLASNTSLAPAEQIHEIFRQVLWQNDPIGRWIQGILR